MKKIVIATALLIATFMAGGIVAEAFAGTCTTTCQQYGNQRTCYTNCY